MNEGWICPRCRKSNAPDVKSCDCGDDHGATTIAPAKPPYIWWPPYRTETFSVTAEQGRNYTIWYQH